MAFNCYELCENAFSKGQKDVLLSIRSRPYSNFVFALGEISNSTPGDLENQ